MSVENEKLLKDYEKQTTSTKNELLTKEERNKKNMRDMMITVLAGLIIGFILKTFIFGVVIVNGESMSNTLHTGNIGVISLLADKDSIEHGEIITFPKEGEVKYIKRVIGVAGDKVALKDNKVYINGKKLEEKYAKYDIGDFTQIPEELSTFKETTIPKGYYFVMGDNRFNSKDSRNGLGLVKSDSIIGTYKFTLVKVPNGQKEQ